MQTAGGTLITVLLTWLATLFLTRKRIAWRVYTDDDFKLDREQAESAGERTSLKIEVPPKAKGKTPDVVDKPRLLPAAPVIWCTDSTTKLLQFVADIPGAIGYAQVGDVAAYPGGGVTAVSLDGLSGRSGDIGRGGYTPCPDGGSSRAAALCAAAGQ